MTGHQREPKPNFDIEPVRKLFQELINALLDDGERADLSVLKGDRTYCFTIDPKTPGITGKLIGKGGATIQAMRKLLIGISTKHGVRSVLEINDERRS